MLTNDSLVGDELLHRLHFGGIDVARLAQVALALGGLLVEDVALESLGALDQAALGQRQALGRAAMRLLLGHDGGPPLR